MQKTSAFGSYGKGVCIACLALVFLACGSQLDSPPEPREPLETVRPPIPMIEDDGSQEPRHGDENQVSPGNVSDTPVSAPAVPLTAAPIPASADDANSDSNGDQPEARLEDTLEFMHYAATRTPNRRNSGTVLEDIIAHLPPRYGQTYYDADPITHGHETCHGIHSDLRNHHNPDRRNVNGFYVLEDRAILIEEPNFRKRDINEHVPQSLRASRFDLYLEGSRAWDDSPLYIWDEWNSYINGSAVGVDMVSNGLWNREWRDGVAGTVEFTVYAIAVGLAVEAKDPTYFAREPNFLAFMAWNGRRGMDIFRQGQAYEQFAWDRQDAYYERFKNDAEAEPIRDFCRRHFGDAWVREVIFGEPAEPNDPRPEPPNDPRPEPPNDPRPEPPNDPRPEPPNDPQPEPPNDPEPNTPDGEDDDGDNISNQLDRCSNTPAGATVWKMGEWVGCAGGQFRDPPRTALPDADGDGIPDADDLCGRTDAGKAVWRSGEWKGCAEGQLRDGDRP